MCSSSSSSWATISGSTVSSGTVGIISTASAGGEGEGGVACFLVELMISLLTPEWGTWLFVILAGVLKDRNVCLGMEDLVATLRGGILAMIWKLDTKL